MRLILDSSVAGYLFFEPVEPGREQEAACARRLVEPEAGHQILLATPTLVELLSRVPTMQQDVVSRRVQEAVIVLSFDVAAALRTAQFHRAAVKPATRAHRARPWATYDAQIVGIGLRALADGLCTLDDGQAALARRLDSQMQVGPPSAFVAQVPLLSGRRQ